MKERNYKAEYARRKELATKRGYTGVRQASKARKALSLPRRRHTPSRKAAERYLPEIRDVITPGEIGRIRREVAAWSKKHSRNSKSQYSPDMTNAQARAYRRAFVEYPTKLSRRQAALEKKRRIAAYMRDYTDMGDEEWAQKYESIQVG